MTMNNTKRQDSRPIRVRFLDTARALAILSVILVHTGSTAATLSLEYGKTALPVFVSEITNLGRFGVQLFFVLSGVLVASLYKTNGSGNSWRRTFSLKRIGRILPLWTAFLILQIFLYLSPLRDWSSLAKLNNSGTSELLFIAGVIALTMTFTLWVLPDFWNTVIAGGWSIQVEMAHYFLFLFLNPRSLVTWVRILCVSQFINLVAFLASLAPASIVRIVGNAILRFGICNSFFFFALGVIAVRLMDQWKTNDKHLEFDSGLAWPAVCTFVFMVLTPGVFADTVTKAGFVALALLAAYVSSRIQSLKAIFTSLARYSYFMYFYHFWVLAAIVRLFGKYGWSSSLLTPFAAILLLLVLFVLTTGVSLALGSLSFRFFEQPIQKWLFGRGARWLNLN